MRRRDTEGKCQGRRNVRDRWIWVQVNIVQLENLALVVLVAVSKRVDARNPLAITKNLLPGAEEIDARGGSETTEEKSDSGGRELHGRSAGNGNGVFCCREW